MSEWTVETLRYHLQALIEANDRRYEERFTAQEQAVKDALAANKEALAITAENAEKWRMNANEWRGAMNDRERLLMPRDVADQRFDQQRRDIDTLKLQQSTQAGGKAMAVAIFGAALALAGLGVAILVKLWH